MDRASFLVSPGDSVGLSTKPSVRERAAIIEAVECGPQVKLPTFLAHDPDDRFLGRVLVAPMRVDVLFPVTESAIVEFYAR